MNFLVQDNGNLWQTSRGRCPASVRAWPIYLQLESVEAVKKGLERMRLVAADGGVSEPATEPVARLLRALEYYSK